ncbi:MAG: hypothetical protein H7A38_05795 [Chlamydiales bacterium]|nr:hypothetical protein [Chlamydiales bacterium]
MESDIVGNSLERLSNGSDTAMVYGFFDFGVFHIQQKLDELGKKVLYYYSLSHEKFIPTSFSIILRPADDSNTLEDCCKLSLTNYVVNNYLRSLRGEKILPFFFCIDSNRNIEFSPLNLSNPSQYRKIKAKELITVKELRRAYKLCYDRSVDPRLRRVALKTFQFIKVYTDKNDKLKGVTNISPPWMNRKPVTTEKGWKKCRDEKNWRYQVNQTVKLLCCTKSFLN